MPTSSSGADDEFYQMDDLFNSRRFHDASDAFGAFKRAHKSDLDRRPFIIIAGSTNIIHFRYIRG